MVYDSLRDLKVGAWAGKKSLVSLGVLGFGEKALQRVSVSLGNHLSCGSGAPSLGEPTPCTSRGERQGGACRVPRDGEMEKEARRRVAKDSGHRMGPEVGEGPGWFLGLLHQHNLPPFQASQCTRSSHLHAPFIPGTTRVMGIISSALPPASCVTGQATPPPLRSSSLL